MSQFGMQMPGGRHQRSSGPDVYTALIFLGVVVMGVAVGMLWVSGSKVAPDGMPFNIQDPDRIQLNTDN